MDVNSSNDRYLRAKPPGLPSLTTEDADVACAGVAASLLEQPGSNSDASNNNSPPTAKSAARWRSARVNLSAIPLPPKAPQLRADKVEI